MTITSILTDLEGTTTDIRFVHNVLFPYAREHLASYVTSQWNNPEVASIVKQVRDEIDDPQADQAAIITVLTRWIDQDKKITPLKALQGLMWADGYANGDFTGHLYKDAYEHLSAWKKAGLSLNVFSSGSVNAQKLLFKYSDYGDLTGLFDGFYDTNFGHKREQSAYESIAKAMGTPAGSILFLSDIQEELDAAKAAGMHTCLLERDDKIDSPRHKVVQSFDQISF